MHPVSKSLSVCVCVCVDSVDVIVRACGMC